MSSKGGINIDAFKFVDASSREDIVQMARTAEAAERYEDMCVIMKKLIKVLPDKTLNIEERNLLSVAYKNVIGTLRASWRTLSTEDLSGMNQSVAAKYAKFVEVELESVCTEVLENIATLVSNSVEPDEKVFYLKMQGDYNRYLAESIPQKEKYAKDAARFYEEAYQAATEEDGGGVPALAPTHPIRLGLALNYSVCYYEILKNKSKACELAKSAFDDAISKLDKLEESDYKDSTLIMQLLRDNLTLWSSAEQDDEQVQVEDLSDEEN